MQIHEKYMKEALKQAYKAENIDEVPIGCVIVKHDKIIAKAHNKRETKQEAIAHAEILAIQKACKKLNSWRLEGCTIYVTLEPCPMCAGAILLSRIDNVVYGAKDKKGGCIDSCMRMYESAGFNHYPSVISGICEDACGNILTDFFKKKRMQKKEKVNRTI